MNETELEDLIQLLQKYEHSIADLYETFASLFETSGQTWINFAKEERIHAKWLHELHSQLKDEDISVEQTTITAQSTGTAISYIENQVGKLANQKPDLAQALNIAIDIEKSLLESSYFKLFKFNGPKAQELQDRLKKETRFHIDRLIEWRANIKSA